MNHLSIDEVIEFVSCEEMNEETIAMIKSVNEHIRKCPECLKLVQAFQTVYDEFTSLALQGDFKNYVYNVSNLKGETEIDGYR